MITLTTAFHEFLNAKHRAKSTRTKYTARLSVLMERHGHRPVSAVSPSDLFVLFDEWESRLADASLAVHRSCMVALYNFCIERGYCESNPAAAVRRYDERPTVVNLPPADDVAAVLDVCRRWSQADCPQRVRDATLVYLAAVSGKRRGEVQVLKLTAVVGSLKHPTGAGVYVVGTTGKTGRTRLIFNEEAATMLRRWVGLRPAAPHDTLFVSLSPGPHYGKAIGERPMEAAGVGLITYQQLRRLKATDIARRFGLHIAAEVLGHSSGVQVIRDYYYNPDLELSYRAVLETVR